GARSAVRKPCRRLAGGGLARAAAGAAGLWALLLSDVVGDDPATIASGPTVADPSTFADAVAVLDRHLPPAAVPPAVRAHLARGERRTVKPGDPALARVRTVGVGGNRAAVTAAVAAASARGYTATAIPEPLGGDAAAAGRALAGRLRTAPRDRPVALVAGGETTVRVQPGRRGGRGQQLAPPAPPRPAGERGAGPPSPGPP